jgi:hypothetical protein
VGMRHPLREFISNCIEAYEIGATPALSRIYREMEPEQTNASEDNAIAHARFRLLCVGIDVKYLFNQFCEQLASEHGTKRVEILHSWLKHGKTYIMYNLSDWQKKALYADIRRLGRIISAYKAWNR